MQWKTNNSFSKIKIKIFLKEKIFNINTNSNK